jgi:photosystem II stability/assembly factor-like uncharacterized protein
MKDKEPLAIVLICLSAILFTVLPSALLHLFFQSGPPRRGNPIESYEATNNHFKIKITAYVEEGVYLLGTYYRYSSSKANEDDWQEFMVFRHDDRPEVPRDQVRFVNDRVGYVFIGGQFAASTDAGETWNIWDAKRVLVNKKYGPIKDVEMTGDGRGEMTISPIEKGEEEIKLKTSNNGREWKVTQGGA